MHTSIPLQLERELSPDPEGRVPGSAHLDRRAHVQTRRAWYDNGIPVLTSSADTDDDQTPSSMQSSAACPTSTPSSSPPPHPRRWRNNNPASRSTTTSNSPLQPCTPTSSAIYTFARHRTAQTVHVEATTLRRCLKSTTSSVLVSKCRSASVQTAANNNRDFYGPACDCDSLLHPLRRPQCLVESRGVIRIVYEGDESDFAEEAAVESYGLGCCAVRACVCAADPATTWRRVMYSS